MVVLRAPPNLFLFCCQVAILLEVELLRGEGGAEQLEAGEAAPDPGLGAVPGPADEDPHVERVRRGIWQRIWHGLKEDGFFVCDGQSGALG